MRCTIGACPADVGALRALLGECRHGAAQPKEGTTTMAQRNQQFGQGQQKQGDPDRKNRQDEPQRDRDAQEREQQHRERRDEEQEEEES